MLLFILAFGDQSSTVNYTSCTVAIQKLPTGDGPGSICWRFITHMAGRMDGMPGSRPAGTDNGIRGTDSG